MGHLPEPLLRNNPELQTRYRYFMKEKSFLQTQAYDSIKNSILSGGLEPGRLYSETKLSAQIGISRTPMRGAAVLKPGWIYYDHSQQRLYDPAVK